jgi:hypothetical protein
MELVSIQLARFLAFFETGDLDPRGKLHYPELFAALVQKYQFQKFPQKYEEFDLQKGIVLWDGKWEKGHIFKIEIHPGGIVVDTRSSTQDSEELFDQCLTWAASRFGLRYQKEIVKRRGYVSQVVFKSDAPILSAISEPLAKLANSITHAVEALSGEKISFEPTGVWIHTDTTIKRLYPSLFSIQRRAETPFSENKYFSDAPLPTDTHLQMLKMFETDVLSAAK